ncbi:MAG TPA: TetR/AcrR family transcriptional regulator [Ktedonobacterales bacterium]|nr:TetR/AcrR family transcriptional regulator [Ktedonobacterales bacterium]
MGQRDEPDVSAEQQDGGTPADPGERGNRREQILDAALEEFAGEGYGGASISRIAKRAKLASQALIYWYFPNKEALFQAVVGRHLPIVQAVSDPALLERPPEEALPLLARAYLAMADRPGAARLVRLLAPAVLRRPEMAELLGGRVIGRVLSVIETYLARQVELGRMRPHDVRAGAHAFVGMTLPQLGGKLFLPVLKVEGLSDDVYVEAIVAIFLRGLRPEQ